MFPNIKRDTDGKANWKLEYDKLFDHSLGLDRMLEPSIYALKATMEFILELRSKARQDKDFKRADEIREYLATHQIVIKDTEEGVSWRIHGSPIGTLIKTT